MAMKCIPTYSDGTNEIRFVPFDGAPGFTHRVIINRKQVAWLADNYKPSVKAAEFFLKEHGHKAPANPA